MMFKFIDVIKIFPSDDNEMVWIDTSPDDKERKIEYGSLFSIRYDNILESSDDLNIKALVKKYNFRICKGSDFNLLQLFDANKIKIKSEIDYLIVPESAYDNMTGSQNNFFKEIIDIRKSINYKLFEKRIMYNKLLQEAGKRFELNKDIEVI